MATMPSGQPAPNTNEHQANPTKRNHRQRKHHPAHPHHLTDGALSDSVLNHTSSPQLKRTPKHRQHDAAIGPHAHPAHSNGYPHTHRPPSLAAPTIHPATPPKETAYAGPTFQASPAPSSLPVPKFFSRSVPNVAAQSSLTARMGRDTASEDPEDRQSTPEPDVVGIPKDGHKSPLDFIFNADRQEKSRSLSGLSPEMARKEVPRYDSDGNFPNETTHRASSSQHLSQPSQRPALSPEISRTPPAAETSAERDAQTAALKALLFNNINNTNAPSHSPPPAQSRSFLDPSPARQYYPSPAPHTLGRAQETPSPSQGRSTSGPSTPTPLSEHDRADGYYAPHYGNQRNLSPLFKAASSTKSGTVPGSRGPSGLRRQETASDDSPPPPTIDPNSFSRGYLEQHSRASPSPHYMPFANGRHQHQQAPPAAATSYANPPMASHANAASSDSASSPRASKPADQGGNSTRDIKGMEDDLRRMLNLNVLNN